MNFGLHGFDFLNMSFIMNRVLICWNLELPILNLALQGVMSFYKEIISANKLIQLGVKYMILLIFLSYFSFEVFKMLALIFQLVILRIKIVVLFGKLFKHFFIFLSFVESPFKFLIVLINSRFIPIHFSLLQIVKLVNSLSISSFKLFIVLPHFLNLALLAVRNLALFELI